MSRIDCARASRDDTEGSVGACGLQEAGEPDGLHAGDAVPRPGAAAVRRHAGRLQQLRLPDDGEEHDGRTGSLLLLHGRRVQRPALLLSR